MLGFWFIQFIHLIAVKSRFHLVILQYEQLQSLKLASCQLASQPHKVGGGIMSKCNVGLPCVVQCEMYNVPCSMYKCALFNAQCAKHSVGLPCHPSQSPAAESLLIRGFNHPAGKSSLFTDNSRLYSPPWKVKRSSKLSWTFSNLPRLPLMNSIKTKTSLNQQNMGKITFYCFDTPGHGLDHPCVCEALFLVSG